MVRPMQIHAIDHLTNSIPLGIGLFVAVSAIVALCAKQARRATRTSYDSDEFEKMSDQKFGRKWSTLKSTISNKAIPFILYDRKTRDDDSKSMADKVEEGFGEGGLWQKEILMGEKCQPLEFSGVIYYDCDGNQISELPPKSPRPSSPFPSFSFPAPAEDEMRSP